MWCQTPHSLEDGRERLWPSLPVVGPLHRCYPDPGKNWTTYECCLSSWKWLELRSKISLPGAPKTHNRPFYWYGGHIVLIRFKEYYGCPGGSRSVFTRAFRANFWLSFPRKGSSWGKKVVVRCLNVIMTAFSRKNIQWSSLFARKARVNTERVLPGHPIILLKSSKFNMAAVSVKRSN